jgi:hypothetical protein
MCILLLTLQFRRRARTHIKTQAKLSEHLFRCARVCYYSTVISSLQHPATDTRSLFAAAREIYLMKRPVGSHMIGRSVTCHVSLTVAVFWACPPPSRRWTFDAPLTLYSALLQ